LAGTTLMERTDMRCEFRRILFLSLTLLTLAFSASADLLFDNSTTDLKYRFNPGTQEVGDQIVLADSGFLTQFRFEYYGTNTLSPDNLAFAGNVEAQVKFYLMDGPLFNGENSPGTPRYTSGWSAIGPTVRNTLIYSAGLDFPTEGLLISTTNLTWSVQFRGMGATDEVGVDIYSPATVGKDFPDYWRFDTQLSHWILETNVVAMDFAARFQGTIPEPSVISLAVVGGVVMLIAGRRRRA
jgi:hypothetical protein